MSTEDQNDQNDPPDRREGWEGLSEEAEGGSLSPSSELEAALQEASEAVEARETGTPTKPPAKPSTDEMVLEAITNELQSLKSEYESTNDKYVRLQAEFENFRRRSLKERQEAHTYGHQNLVKDLLATVDNLDRAIEHAEQSGSGGLEALLQGVELVRRELLTALAKHHVTEIETETTGEDGDKQRGVFDPALHEAMGQVPDDTVPPNTIVQVLQKGYQLRDRMLRPARVLVAREPTEAEKANDDEKA